MTKEHDFAEKTPCPSCGYGFDTSSMANGSDGEPSDGDVTICINCAEPAMFVGDRPAQTLRKPTPEEKVDILQNPDVVNAMFAVRAVRSRRDP